MVWWAAKELHFGSCCGAGGAIAGRRRGFGDENFYGPLCDSKIQEAGWLGLGASLGLTKKLNICNRLRGVGGGEEETRL